jgi:hypothetical protein
MTEQDKWINYAASMYKRTKSILEKTLTYRPDDKEIISVFEQACGFDRGERAGQQRIDERAAREQKQDEPATSKQLQYIDDLGGHWDKDMTKKQAMAEIDRLKNK